MKKIMVTCIGLFFVMAFATSYAAPLMPNGTIVRTKIRLAKNAPISGIMVNKGETVMKSMYLFYPSGKIPGADFPAEVATRDSGGFILNQESTEGWTNPVFYGDNKVPTGSSGVYFQFRVLESGALDVNYVTQGKARGGCTPSSGMLTVDFTG